MIQTQATIINKLGLHARAASKFVSTTSNFTSQVKVGLNGREVDGKSIMAIMMLAAGQGTVLDLTFDGEDEQAAAEALNSLINDYFGEGE
ncbi:phosphocarrier protein HPr [Endozoicomonas montiporae]|uniref:Phosphocarrier protein HPr n=2 Tax=Endozoicomonas montiporae TaxID=1027273 RepID=A0A081N2W0_9GAMM|nr:HPr family phosphocarrier protein [Endozoicomonas montiporae]AMO58052.1 PTS system HPr component [Endozoicomonas montiporae CL-33]KEQ12783.1 phosphocarrier protein HPr [Endozoicomonas montiporae]